MKSDVPVILYAEFTAKPGSESRLRRSSPTSPRRYARSLEISSSASTPNATTRLSSLLDRKSTRLNSSHQIISYAVFCLKKKKKNNNQFCLRKKKTIKKKN